MDSVLQTRDLQGPEQAVQQLHSSLSKSQHQELLYALEAGELLRQAKNYDASNSAWFTADEQVKAWERAAMLDPAKLFSYLGASTVNERIKIYEGQDYEKTWLTTRIAMNHLAQNNWDHARVAIRRSHEREAIIANFRSKEFAEIQEQSREKGWNVLGDVLGNYPVQYIESPDVLALHNSYQNIFSHYLAGFIYEALGEPALAAPGYRNAIELAPSSELLKEGLRGLETRMRQSHNTNNHQTDVLFIIETGNAPERTPFNVNLPFFYEDKEGELAVIYIPIAFPIIRPSPPAESLTLGLGEHRLKAELIMDLNLMARRALHDEMPGLIFRGMTRAASKGALQYYANETDPLLGLAAALFSITTEHADDRNWRTLPGNVLLARAYLPPGIYPLQINGRETNQNIQIDGRYAVVAIRTFGRLTLVAQTATHGKTSLTTTLQEE